MNTQLENKIYDTIVVGAGISGVSAAYHLKKYSPKTDFLVLEGRENIGGTWDLFKYPGIRADTDMHTMGFSFKPWNSKKFIADGPSIMGYLNETIEENSLKNIIKFNMHIESASWKSPIGDAPALTAEQTSQNEAGTHIWRYDWNESGQSWELTNYKA